MYPPKHFVINSSFANKKVQSESHCDIDPQLLNLIARNPLATLLLQQALPDTENQEETLHISHIPCHFIQVLPKKDVYQKNSLIMHVSNHHPLAQQLTVNNKDSDIGVHSVSINLIFHGEQAYISPNDVAVEDRAAHKVPTWNYSKVHVKAKACAVFNQDEKYALMEQSINYFERANNNPWLLTDVPKKAIEQMFKAITFVNVSITDIEGSFKLSQNKPRKVIEQIAEQLTRNSHADLAKQMLAQPT